jgi:hypothetical protein
MKYRAIMLQALLMAIGSASTFAAPNAAEIQLPGTNLFAGQEVEYLVDVHVPADFKGRLAWGFSAVNGQIFQRGRGETAVAGKGADSVRVKIVVETPPVKPGVVLEGKLELNLIGNAQGKPEATLTRKIYIFPPDPFFGRQAWLKELNLAVFDPSDKSRTIEALEALKVPHERVKEVDRLAHRKSGVIVVGEGVSFKEERGLSETLVLAAQRGCKVICLAAEEGSFALPGIGGNEADQSGLTFRRNGAIRELDKRLDPEIWGSKGPLVSHSLHLTPDDGKVMAEIQANAKGWPWVQVDYAAGGALLFCQFKLVQHWDASPAPRYLFARMLDSLSSKSTVETK